MAEVSIVLESIKLLKMSDDEYFSKKYSHYLSNSKLSLINPDEGGSSELFKAGYSKEYSDSFALGSAVHAMLLQPEYYEISPLTKPNSKLGLWAEEVFKLRKSGETLETSFLIASEKADYYKYKLNGNKLKTAIKKSLPFYLKRIKLEEDINKATIILSDSLKPKFEELFSSLDHNKIKKVLFPEGFIQSPEVFNEYALLADLQYVDEETGEITIIPFKAKLDNFSIDREEKVVHLVDLKTSRKPVSYFMGNIVKKYDESGIYSETKYVGSFQKYHYYRQMAVYLFLLSSAIKSIYNLTDYKFKASMLVVETMPDFNTKVFLVNNSYIKEGLAEFKKLLGLVVNNG